ncbi:MAG TPA: MFS transporter, partial [Myxococcaceae bacterium]|nr:MFS transporter [Myxococcaceae bacterium]
RGGGLMDGIRYLWRNPQLRATFLMLFFIGTLGLNFPIYISTMSVTVFHRGPGGYGLATSVMAVGSLLGALATAARGRPTTPLLVVAAAAFGGACALAASMPTFLLFALSLTVVGVSVQTFTTGANAFVQLSTDAAMRGRLISLFMAVALGAAPIGAPLVGWVADHFGPRWALLLATAGGLSAALGGLALGASRRAVAATTPVDSARAAPGG